jgi:type IV secretion/conjugal transfer VirB4 family ATPase
MLDFLNIFPNKLRWLKKCLSGKFFLDNNFGVSDLLLYSHFVDNGIIFQTDASFFTMYRFYGKDFGLATDEELNVLANKVKNGLNLLGNGWCLHVDTLRFETSSYIDINKCYFNNQLAKIIDQERRQIYQKQGKHFENIYTLSFTYKPNFDLGKNISNLFKNNKKNKELDYEASLKYFRDKLIEIIEILSYELIIEKLSNEEILSYISWYMTGEKIRLMLPKNYMSLKYLLSSKDIIAGENPQIGDKYIKTVTIMGFPSESYCGIIDKLNYLELEYRFNTRFIFIDQYEGNKIIEKLSDLWYQKRVNATDTVKMSLAIDSHIKINQYAHDNYLDAELARTINDQGDVRFGYYTATLLIFNEDAIQLEDNANLVRGVLRNLGFQSQIERYHSLECYFGSLPGYVYANIRKWLISTQNLADLLPITAIGSGIHYHPCSLYEKESPPLFYAMTNGKTPLRLSLHVADNGHTLIIGPTGSGKSTLLNFLMVQHLRYKNSQIFVFDKNRSSLPFCYGVEGKFFDIGLLSSKLFQPFRKLDLDEDFQFAEDFVEQLCLLNGMKDTFNEQNKLAIRKALYLMKEETSEERRTISYLRHLIQDYDNTIANILDIFSGESFINNNFTENNGFIARLFDANQDDLYDVNNDVTVFEMSKIMELGDKVILPLLNYLIHQINKRIRNNKPTLIVFDESFIFFSHPLFRQKIIEWVKTVRKFNVAIIFATQELNDLFKHEDLMNTLKTNCATKIYLPNPLANSLFIKDSYLSMGLNIKQINIIAEAIKGDYMYHSALGIYKFNLEIKSNQISYQFIARTNNKDINDAINLYNNYDIFWQKWLQLNNINYEVINEEES